MTSLIPAGNGIKKGGEWQGRGVLRGMLGGVYQELRQGETGEEDQSWVGVLRVCVVL